MNKYNWQEFADVIISNGDKYYEHHQKKLQQYYKSVTEQCADIVEATLDRYLKEVHNSSLEEMLSFTRRFNNVHWKHFECITSRENPFFKQYMFKGEVIFVVDYYQGEFLCKTYWEGE